MNPLREKQRHLERRERPTAGSDRLAQKEREKMFFFKGIMIGFLIAAPVGPIGMLCINRTLNSGRSAGIVSGLGAATADALYGSIAGFGLVFLSQFLIERQFWFRIAGGLLLCFIGITTCRSKSDGDSVRAANKKSLLSAYASTFLLTITNPITILSFGAIFTGVGIINPGSDYGAALLLVSGVFLGSLLWWVILSNGVELLRQKITAHWMAWINRISGALIFLFGLFSMRS